MPLYQWGWVYCRHSELSVNSASQETARWGAGRVKPHDVTCPDEVNPTARLTQSQRLKVTGVKPPGLFGESPTAAVIPCHSQVNTPDGMCRGHDLFNEGVYVFLCRDNNRSHSRRNKRSESPAVRDFTHSTHAFSCTDIIWHITNYDGISYHSFHNNGTTDKTQPKLYIILYSSAVSFDLILINNSIYMCNNVIKPFPIWQYPSLFEIHHLVNCSTLTQSWQNTYEYEQRC